jgi:hypothetical protein
MHKEQIFCPKFTRHKTKEQSGEVSYVCVICLINISENIYVCRYVAFYNLAVFADFGAKSAT